MSLLEVISDHMAISLVLLIILLVVAVYFALKVSRSPNGTPDLDNTTSATNSTKGSASTSSTKVELDQSPAAKAFRAKLKDINLDLDKD